MKLIDFCVHHWTTVMVLLVLIVVIGTYSYVILPREEAPDIEFPFINVSVSYEGTAPSDMESLVAMPIERKLKGLDGVKEMRSSSSEGSTVIGLEFYPTVDIDFALQKVRDKVDQAKQDLPEDADDPVITEISTTDFPVLMISIVGDVGALALRKIADDLEDLIEAIPGVLDVIVTGAVEREIRVEFDPERISAYNLTVPSIYSAVARNNQDTPGGSMDVGEAKYSLKTPGEIQSPQEVARLPIVTNDMRAVYIEDIAWAEDTIKDRTSLSRLNDKEAVTLVVQKRGGENLPIISKQVRYILGEAKKRLPGVDFVITMDGSDDIKTMIDDLENNILSGLILVLLVIFVSMGFRNAVITSAAIPLSMLITFGILSALGMTLNMVVLFSCILVVGMLVDNAIVLVENSYRHLQMGYDRVTASIMGAKEVAIPVLTSTLTTVAAFVPLLFWPGITGEFMSFLPKTVIIALSASLFAALVFNPSMCGRFMKLTKTDRNTRLPKPGEAEGVGHLGIIRLAYRALLVRAVANKWKTLLLSCLSLVVVLTAYGIWGRGVEFFPEADPREIYIDVKAPEGTNLTQSDELVRRVENVVKDYKDVKYRVANVGSTGAGMTIGEGGGGGTNQSRVSLKFVDRLDRSVPSTEILKQARAALTRFVGARLDIQKERMGPPSEKPVNVEISGDNLATLEDLSDKAKALIQDTPGLVELDDDYDPGRPEIRVRVDKEKAELMGLDTLSVASMVRAAFQGIKMGDFKEGNDEYDIIARLPEERRNDFGSILTLNVPSPTGRPIPISSVADIELANAPGVIRRIDQRKAITVFGNVEGRLPDDVLRDVRTRLADFKLPSGYMISYTGENKDKEEAGSFLMKAFIVALLLIALTLVTQFDSITKPFIIMTSVILSIMGVFMGLLIGGNPFGIIMTGIAVISLAGVVVNNAIVLLDYVEKLRHIHGLDMQDAVIEAGLTRFRPVMLTAITTILGLIPMVVGISYNFRELCWVTDSDSTQWWGPMATSVAVGLSIATVLTLVVVPCLYVALERVRETLGKIRRAVSPPTVQSDPVKGLE